jgi:hypothetical protein
MPGDDIFPITVIWLDYLFDVDKSVDKAPESVDKW